MEGVKSHKEDVSTEETEEIISIVLIILIREKLNIIKNTTLKITS